MGGIWMMCEYFRVCVQDLDWSVSQNNLDKLLDMFAKFVYGLSIQPLELYFQGIRSLHLY